MSSTSDVNVRVADRRLSVPQILALAIGAIYTLVGIAGFAVTGFDNFAEHHGDSLLGFHVNPLHNVVHLLIGVAGLIMAWRLDLTRLYGWLLLVGYGAAFVYGLFAVNNDDINFLAINGADNVLHALSALAGLAVAVLPVRTGSPGADPVTDPLGVDEPGNR